MSTFSAQSMILKIGTGLLATVLLIAVVSADAAEPASVAVGTPAKTTTPTNAAETNGTQTPSSPMKKRIARKAQKAPLKTTAANATFPPKAAPHVGKIVVAKKAIAPLAKSGATKPAALNKTAPKKKTTLANGQTTATTAQKVGTPSSTKQSTLSQQIQDVPSAALATTVKAETARPLISGGFSVGRARSLIDHEDGTYGESNEFEARVGFSLTKNWSLSASAAYSQDTRNSENSDWSDSSVSLSHSPMRFGSSVFTWAPTTLAILPTSKESHTLRSLKTALGESVGFGFVPGFLPKGLSLGVGLSAAYSFYEFETALDGRVNSPWSFGQSVSIGYEYKNVSISALLKHKSAISFQDQVREAFEHAEELGYQVTKNVGLAVGHALKGSMLKANGTDTNLSLTNENDSVIYGQISASF